MKHPPYSRVNASSVEPLRTILRIVAYRACNRRLLGNNQRRSPQITLTALFKVLQSF
jgi:hypothetical protein